MVNAQERPTAATICGIKYCKMLDVDFRTIIEKEAYTVDLGGGVADTFGEDHVFSTKEALLESL